MAHSAPSPELLASTVRIAHLVYALHAFAIVTGIVGSPSVIGSFVASLPSLAAIVINYVKRSDARGSWVDSHFRWQIRTFWFTLLWMLLATLCALTIIGLPITIALFAIVTVWVIYRVARGWIRLNDQRAMYV